jgi:phosphoglucomutase
MSRAVTVSPLAGRPATKEMLVDPARLEREYYARQSDLKDLTQVITLGGWFAARPSGTEDIYEIYAESFRDSAHLDALVREAQALVDAAVTERT